MIEDKYFDKRILEKLVEILLLPCEMGTDEENLVRMTSLIKLSFIQLMTY